MTNKPVVGASCGCAELLRNCGILFEKNCSNKFGIRSQSIFHTFGFLLIPAACSTLGFCSRSSLCACGMRIFQFCNCKVSFSLLRLGRVVDASCGCAELSANRKTKSFPLSALILLRRLFLLLARHSAQALSALASCVGCPLGFTAPSRQSLQAAFALNLIAAFRFLTPSENRKTKSFPLSVFRFPFLFVSLGD